MGEQPELRDLPEWVKSLGLPPEAVAAIDRYWMPVWESLGDDLSLLPAHPRPAAERIEFEAVRELEPGAAWRERFEAMWPGYRAWYLRDARARPNLAGCMQALERHMPEIVPIHARLVELAGGDDLAARVLSLHEPPGFVVGCSQGAWTRAGGPVLVRNYDYPAERLEGIVYLTEWTGRRVLGMSDCLWGLLDGINDAGLAVSLTFGGRRDVGTGFGVPLVVRYVLETCDSVAEARAAIARIPVHAAQNLTLLDASGEFVTAFVGPGRPAEFHRRAATTNHQGKVEWPEYVQAIRSVERERCVVDLLADATLTRDRFVASFLEPPLHSTSYSQGFGTLYTAAYFPTERRVEYRWPGIVWEQSLDGFDESTQLVELADAERRAA
jgi:predicted choloylglycine hydrolase